MYKKIIKTLKEKDGPITQKELSTKLPEINRAVLLGYLRCLSDLGKIKSKEIGKAKAYYL
jgi:predicted transcriptional regulator